MKVRILGNTIRLRLKMHETEELALNGVVEEKVEFGPEEGDVLSFQLKRGDEIFSIDQQVTIITINIPQSLIDKWVSTDLVGFEENIATSKGKIIKLLVEKDFACLDGDREEEEGSYPNPMEDAAC